MSKESKYYFKFEDLKVYQKAMDFGELVDGIVKKFSNHELYALSSQFRRAADSIALNIAEGYPGSDAQICEALELRYIQRERMCELQHQSKKKELHQF